MKKQEFRNFIKEVVKHVLKENMEPYDAETDQFGAASRDRTTPSSNPQNADLLKWAEDRLSREGNRLNRDTLERVIQMLKTEMGT